MILAHVEAVRNIKCAVEENFKQSKFLQNTGHMCVSSYVPLFIERGELMVEFDNIKISLSNYDEPLLEMGNSL